MSLILLIIGLFLSILAAFGMIYSEVKYYSSPYSLRLAVILVGSLGALFIAFGLSI